MYWRRLNKGELEYQAEGGDLFCFNCSIRGQQVFADWRRDGEFFGGNAQFFCNGCTPSNLLLDIEDKLATHLLTQDDAELKKLGDAFTRRREMRRVEGRA